MNKIKFIIEIASTHNGSIIELKKLLNKIKLKPEDYVKLQIFDNKELCHQSSKLYSGLKKIEIKQKFWLKIINKYKKKYNLILEPFDEKSYFFSKKFKKDVLVKISSSEHDNIWMIKDAIKNFKKIFINISGYDLKDIIKIIEENKNSKNKVVLMYGFQSFPSNPKDLRLQVIKKIIKLGYSAGYADHSDTLNLIGSYLSTTQAIDNGADFIEKHITYNRAEKKPDYISSFNPDEMFNYICFFKDEYKKFKINRKNISNAEKKYCNIMGKHAVIMKDYFKNDKLKIEDVKFLRTGVKGLNRYELNLLIKKKSFAKKKIKKNSVIQINHFL